MSTIMTGFLVVLKVPEYRGERGAHLNPRYSGVNRVPGWLSEYPEETAALDRYVFGDLKSRETNLIPDLATALKLLNDFSSSPREFEIILCCAGPSDGASRR